MSMHKTMKSNINNLIFASRPWSFTTSLIPILITAAVVKSPFKIVKFISTLVMGISVQAGANLINTYYDYINGVDYGEGGEKTLVQKKVYPPEKLLYLGVCCFIFATFCVLYDLVESQAFRMLYFMGCFLAIFYTANPIGLKYIAMGDIAIFVCFGPLLMQTTSLLLTGDFLWELNFYAIPIGCLTEAILHANNARDINSDAKAGATTLATIIGFNFSFVVYILLILASYMSVIYIAAFYHSGVLLTLITLPLSANLILSFQSQKMLELPENTAKVHLPFGILTFAGILLTSEGFL